MDRLRALLLGISAFALLGGAGTTTQTELDCEEAKAHLMDCCPDFQDSQLACYYEPGCDTSPTYPDLTSDEAHDIAALSCDDVRAAGLCTKSYHAGQN